MAVNCIGLDTNTRSSEYDSNVRILRNNQE